MSDDLKHECGVAMVVLRNPQDSHSGDFGGTKLALLMEKQHNRGQDGAGAAILAANPEPGAPPYWIAKSASETPLADVLAAIARRKETFSRKERIEHKEGFADFASFAAENTERIFLGHLRYATYGKGDEAFCHPFVHEASELEHTLLLAGNFNLTNTAELFEEYSRSGEFPTSRSDGYLICEMLARELSGGDLCRAERVDRVENSTGSTRSTRPNNPIAVALLNVLQRLDGAWTLCGMTGDGWAFATRDPHGIRPGWYYASEEVVAVASERPAIQAAFDVPPEAVRELPPGQALLVSPSGELKMAELCSATSARPCAFERIYFSRANDADIHRERKALGAALLPQILMSAQADLSDIFFSYIPNSAQVAFHGLLEELFHKVLMSCRPAALGVAGRQDIPRFGQIAVKDAKFRTFIADAASREEFYKHVYDVTYGLVRPGKDTLVVLDDSIVRGNTMRNAILPMLDRLGPKRIVIASSAPPIRYPDCYGIDMSTLGELVAFRALVNLLGSGDALSCALAFESASLPELYARFTDDEHCAEIARLLTPPGMKAEVKVVFQTVDNMRRCLHVSDGVVSDAIGDWYFTGDYPTPGGYKVLAKALENYLERKTERSY